MPNCSKLKQHINVINAKQLKAKTAHQHNQCQTAQNWNSTSAQSMQNCSKLIQLINILNILMEKQKMCDLVGLLLLPGKTQGMAKQKMSSLCHQVKRRAWQNKRCVTWWGYCCYQVKHRAWQNKRWVPYATRLNAGHGKTKDVLPGGVTVATR